jgi:MarR family transcriptional regulator for hemolysin
MKAETTKECAREILDVAPQIMCHIRSQMRSRRTPDLTVPQFRALSFVNRKPDSSLSDVAKHLGLALPSTSKLVDELLKKGLLTREEQPEDRRRVKLAVTSKGLSILGACREGTLTALSEKLATLSDNERATITAAMQTLRVVFAVSVENHC